MYTCSAQSVRNGQYSTSNSLYEVHECSKDHAVSILIAFSFPFTKADRKLSQPNHPHFSLGIDIPTGSGHHRHVQAPVSLSFTEDQDCVVQNHWQDQHRCVGMTWLPMLHSECPPISTYSELSAQTLYYNSLNLAQQPKTSESSDPYITTEISNLLNPAQKSSDRQASKSGEGASMTLLCTRLPLPKASIPFEAWTNPQVKTKERSPLLSQRKRLRSSLILSRLSRTLSPKGQSQEGLKTIMMKRGGSGQKKHSLACLFCRERKIACRRQPEGSDGPSCK